eukprot:788529_1
MSRSDHRWPPSSNGVITYHRYPFYTPVVAVAFALDGSVVLPFRSRLEVQSFHNNHLYLCHLFISIGYIICSLACGICCVSRAFAYCEMLAHFTATIDCM